MVSQHQQVGRRGGSRPGAGAEAIDWDRAVRKLGRLAWRASYRVAGALVGGMLSHEFLDAIPHAEGKTFGLRGKSLLRLDVLEAGAEVLVGAAILWRLATCSGARINLIALGAVGGLLPDLVDIPLKALSGKTILHARRMHWTVDRQHAVLGLLSQIVTAGVAGALLWWGTCR